MNTVIKSDTLENLINLWDGDLFWSEYTMQGYSARHYYTIQEVEDLYNKNGNRVNS